MQIPKISIIVPVYKVERYLDECVTSIVRQTYMNLEIILVDDGSPDKCPQLCDDWAARDPRIRVIHKVNGGLSDARNAGLDVACGEYIMFVDSDDFLDSSIVEDLYDIMLKTNADVACGGIYRYKNGRCVEIYNEIIQADKVTYTGIEQLNNMLNAKVDCGSWGKLYKSNIIGTHRFIKNRYNEDVIFLFSLYPKCSKVVCTCKRYYYYRETEGSVTGEISEKTMDALRNAIEMEHMTEIAGLPVKEAMENYMFRTCLELGYAIQKAGAKKRFPQQSIHVKRYVRSNFMYMIKHRNYYSMRDIIHAMIVISGL